MPDLVFSNAEILNVADDPRAAVGLTSPIDLLLPNHLLCGPYLSVGVWQRHPRSLLDGWRND